MSNIIIIRENQLSSLSQNRVSMTQAKGPRSEDTIECVFIRILTETFSQMSSEEEVIFEGQVYHRADGGWVEHTGQLLSSGLIRLVRDGGVVNTFPLSKGSILNSNQVDSGFSFCGVLSPPPQTHSLRPHLFLHH